MTVDVDSGLNVCLPHFSGRLYESVDNNYFEDFPFMYYPTILDSGRLLFHPVGFACLCAGERDFRYRRIRLRLKMVAFRMVVLVCFQLKQMGIWAYLLPRKLIPDLLYTHAYMPHAPS